MAPVEPELFIKVAVQEFLEAKEVSALRRANRSSELFGLPPRLISARTPLQVGALGLSMPQQPSVAFHHGNLPSMPMQQKSLLAHLGEDVSARRSDRQSQSDQ